MTPMADIFMNIHNETAYANRSANRVAGEKADADLQSDWYLGVSRCISAHLHMKLTLRIMHVCDF